MMFHYRYLYICLYTGPTLVYTVNFEVDIYSYLLLWPGWASSCSLDTSDGGASAGGRDSIPAAQASIRSEAIRPGDVSQEPGSHLPICTPLHWGERLLPCHSGIPHVSSIQTLPNSLASAFRIHFYIIFFLMMLLLSDVRAFSNVLKRSSPPIGLYAWTNHNSYPMWILLALLLEFNFAYQD